MAYVRVGTLLIQLISVSMYDQSEVEISFYDDFIIILPGITELASVAYMTYIKWRRKLFTASYKMLWFRHILLIRTKRLAWKNCATSLLQNALQLVYFS